MVSRTLPPRRFEDRVGGAIVSHLSNGEEKFYER